MHKLNLDRFEDSQPKTLSEEFLFDKIRMVEQTMPADFYKDKNLYKDMKEANSSRETIMYYLLDIFQYR